MGAFLVKEHGPYNYHLRNNCTHQADRYIWTSRCQTCAKEVISKIYHLYGCLSKESNHFPVEDYHLVMMIILFLKLNGHHKCPILLGMLQLIVTIGKVDICTLVSFISFFDPNPLKYPKHCIMGHRLVVYVHFRFILFCIFLNFVRGVFEKVLFHIMVRY